MYAHQIKYTNCASLRSCEDYTDSSIVERSCKFAKLNIAENLPPPKSTKGKRYGKLQYPSKSNSVKHMRSTRTTSLDSLKDDEAGREMNSNEDDDEEKDCCEDNHDEVEVDADVGNSSNSESSHLDRECA